VAICREIRARELGAAIRISSRICWSRPLLPPFLGAVGGPQSQEYWRDGPREILFLSRIAHGFAPHNPAV